MTPASTIHIKFLKHTDDDLPPSERRVEMTTIEPEDLREFQPVRRAIPGPPTPPLNIDLREDVRPATPRRYLDDSTADALAAGGTLGHTHTWSHWEQIKWAGAWLLTGCALGAITVGIVNHCAR